MRLRLAVALAITLAGGCKTVVTTSTEVRPSRYAVRDVMVALTPDSVVAYLVRALAAEDVRVQSTDVRNGTVSAGPVEFAASDGEPALVALITINTQAEGAHSRVRILASSVIAAGLTGGEDVRLMQLAERIERRLEQLLAR